MLISIQFFVCKFDWFSYQFAALISVSCTETVKGKTQIYDIYYIVIMAPILVWEWSLQIILLFLFTQRCGFCEDYNDVQSCGHALHLQVIKVCQNLWS